MSIRRTASSRQSRKASISGSSTAPGEPPQTARIRTKWRTLSSRARSILCISTDKRVYKEHWDDDGSDVLRTRRWSDESWTCSQEGMESLYGAPSIAQQVHAVQVGGNEDAEPGWGEVIRKLELDAKEHPAPSEAAARLIDGTSAHRIAEASPPYYDHAVLLHSNRTRRRTSAADHRQAATGKTIDARSRLLIDAMLQIGDGGGAPRRAPLASATAGTKKANKKGKGKGWEGGTRGTAVSWDEADARRAWEATKSRVMYIEEHGALPEDMEDAERASRERRARRRMGWVEDTTRRQTRVKEDTTLSVRAAKKRRRNGGCWISENGVFVRLCAHRR